MTHQHERTIATWCAILCLVAIFLSQLIVPQEARRRGSGLNNQPNTGGPRQ